MTEAIAIAILGAVFNAGVMWGMLRAVLSRVNRAEKSCDRAHKRIDDFLGREFRAGGTD